MLLLPNKNAVFIHIPHSAGTSMSRYLEAHFESEQIFGLHDSAKKLMDTEYEDYYKFCVVRNHWDWILSKWSYVLKKGGELSKHLYDYAVDLDNSFTDFVEWYLSDECPDLSQTHGVFNWTGKHCTLVDDFIKMNRYQFQGLQKILKNLDIEEIGDFPHFNKSGHGNKREGIYTRRSKDIVREHFEEEIEFFDFKFGV